MTKSFDTQVDFSFVMDIAKSFATVEHVGDTTTTTMFIKGVASSTRRDLEGERFSREGLENIKKSIEDGIILEDGTRTRIPLRSGHREEWEDVLGEIVKAEIDGEDNLWITAQLDEDSYKAQELYRKLSKGKVKLGLSVRGKVTSYSLAWDNMLQKSTPIFHNLLTKEISVTQQPVNPSPYPLAIAKSLLADPNYKNALEESMETDITKSKEDEFLHPALANEKAQKEKTEGTTDENTPEAETVETEKAETSPEVAVESKPIDSPEAPPEPQRVSDTVAEDSDATDVPPGYVAAPHSQSTKQEEAKQEVAPATDPDTSDPAEKLTTALDGILAQVGELKAELEALKNKPVEAQKAQVADPATLEADLDTRIAKAVAAAFDASGLTTLATEVEAVKSVVTDLASQPQDRSISVSKAKDPEDKNDPMVRFAEMKEKGFNPIRAAMNAAYNEKN